MDDAQFERLYAEHAPSLFGFLLYRTGDRTLAEDLLADTFERVLRTRRRFDRRRASEKTWVYTIALNCLRDDVRHRAAEDRAIDRLRELARVSGDPAGGVEELGDREMGGDVRAALERLSIQEREAVALRFGADLTVPEMAQLLYEPLPRVESRLYGAVRKLRAELLPGD